MCAQICVCKEVSLNAVVGHMAGRSRLFCRTLTHGSAFCWPSRRCLLGGNLEAQCALPCDSREGKKSLKASTSGHNLHLESRHPGPQSGRAKINPKLNGPTASAVNAAFNTCTSPAPYGTLNKLAARSNFQISLRMTVEEGRHNTGRTQTSYAQWKPP